MSSIVSPNCVEPLANIVPEEVNSASNFSAVTLTPTDAFPGIIKSPVISIEPPALKLDSHLSAFKVKPPRLYPALAVTVLNWTFPLWLISFPTVILWSIGEVPSKPTPLLD